MSIYLRDYNKDDVHLLFTWANDSAVRQNSFNSNCISFEEHIKWFEKCLSDKSVRIFILCNDKEPIGQLRLIIDSSSESALINYSISETFRGMGYGKQIILLSEEAIKEEKLSIKYLVANVKADNIASNSIFIDCGYSLLYDGEVRKYQKEI